MIHGIDEYKVFHTNRIIWADIAKFIAISLMVLGHSNLHNHSLHIFINSFHMPLFFFLSGLFLKDRSIEESIKKELKNLMQPYFLCSFLALSICWISPFMHPELYPGTSSVVDIFRNALVGIFIMDDNITSYSFLPYASLWFLVALFFSRLIFHLLLLISKKNINIILLVSVLLSAVLFMEVQGIRFFSLDATCMLYPFLVLGYVFNKTQCIIFIKRYSFILMVLTGILLCILSQRNDLVNVHIGDYGRNFFLFYLNSILGILFTLSTVLYLKLDNSKKMAYIGANSLVVLITHGYILIILKTFIRLFGGDLSNLPLSLSFFMMIVVLVISYFLVAPILKYIPAIIGEKRFIIESTNLHSLSFKI